MSIMKLHTAFGEQARAYEETVYGGLLGLIGFVVVKVGERAGQGIDRAGALLYRFLSIHAGNPQKQEGPGFALVKNDLAKSIYRVRVL